VEFQIVVFCGWFADKLEAYLKGSRWNSMVSIKIVTSSSCSSAGDALRELDGLNIIRSDPFILISGDVVANIDLKKAIAFHKQKRKDDSNNIMTLALKKVQKAGGSKPLNDDLVVGMNRKTSQIVIFEDNIKNGRVRVPIELMEDASELEFKSDLLDCNVDICSPELLLQFSDNFDYQVYQFL
jgi:translation initiation factor eIF-2B subunit epsilon